MKTIKEKYHDALYFAVAKINKKKDFAITPMQKNIIEKIIHYEKKYSDITFKNETIAKHLFSTENTIKLSIEDLYRKGYLKHSTEFHNNYGSPAKSRVIRINWDRLQEVLDIIPTELTVDTPNDEVKKELPTDNTSITVVTTEVVEDTPTKEELIYLLSTRCDGLKKDDINITSEHINNGRITRIKQLNHFINKMIEFNKQKV